MRTLLISILTTSVLFITADISAQHSYTKTHSQQVVQQGYEIGLIERVDMDRKRIYVNHIHWHYNLDARSKELMVHLASDYFKHHHPSWNSDGRPPASIYSNRTGKRLARWSTWRGVQLD